MNCKSKIGEMKCCIPIDETACCDSCIKEEIVFLRNNGVNTVASCCGHGDKKLATIVVEGKLSYTKMKDYKYEEVKDWENKTTGFSMWKLKTILPYEK